MEESKLSPQKMTASEASKLLKDKKHVVILTGAGLSAASGIPTFRGNDGLWTKKYKHCDKPEDLATLAFFQKHPEIKWEWTHDFYELWKKSQPNDGHRAIVEFQEFWKLNGMKWSLITQNIDDLHSRLIKQSKVLNVANKQEGEEGFGFTPNVFEIHGNLNYVRCFKEWCLELKKMPEWDSR